MHTTHKIHVHIHFVHTSIYTFIYTPIYASLYTSPYTSLYIHIIVQTHTTTTPLISHIFIPLPIIVQTKRFINSIYRNYHHRQLNHRPCISHQRAPIRMNQTVILLEKDSLPKHLCKNQKIAVIISQHLNAPSSTCPLNIPIPFS